MKALIISVVTVSSAVFGFLAACVFIAIGVADDTVVFGLKSKGDAGFTDINGEIWNK